MEDFESSHENLLKVMGALGLETSQALEDFEYDALDALGEMYEHAPFGQTEDILKEIVTLNIAEDTKQEYIRDAEIWELFQQYDVQFSEEENMMLLYKTYQRICRTKDLTDESCAELLDRVIKSLGYKETGKNLPEKTRTVMFEYLTEIKEEQLRAQTSTLNFCPNCGQKRE